MPTLLTPKLHLVADPHLHGSARRNREVKAALTDIRRSMGPDDWFGVLGDVTQSGQADEYAQAEELICKPFAGRLLLAPGNHDIATAGIFVQAAARRRWAALTRKYGVPTQVRLGGHLVLVLDTCKYSLTPTDLARGRLGERQTGRVEDASMAAAQGVLRLLLLGHHWPWTEDRTLALDDEKAVRALIARAHAGYVGGHTHESGHETGAGWWARCLPDLRSGARAFAVPL